MSKFNSIEISSIVSLHPRVEHNKHFGLFESVRYTPTRSSISSFRNYYSANDAKVLTDIAAGGDARKAMNQMKEISTQNEGKYRLDICISADCRFVAFQVFERQDKTFQPCSQLCFLEGDEASAFENLLA